MKFYGKTYTFEKKSLFLEKLKKFFKILRICYYCYSNIFLRRFCRRRFFQEIKDNLINFHRHIWHISLLRKFLRTSLLKNFLLAREISVYATRLYVSSSSSDKNVLCHELQKQFKIKIFLTV